MKLVAITGGIGAGKSTVARRLCEHGARLIDADLIARTVVDPQTPTGRVVLDRIATLLGSDALNEDGELDRGAVGARIFADDDLRARYNAIVHPAIREATATLIDAQRLSDVVIVHEIPLLSAASEPLPWTYDLVVTVEAHPQERLRRLCESRGYTREHAAERIEAQGSEDLRIAIADVVIRTDGSRDETDAAVDRLWRRLEPLS